MTQAAATDPRALLEFLFQLGQAYLACGEQTAQVELTLRRTALAYGMGRPRIVTFPTAVFITFHDGTEERLTLGEGPTQTLRLDQIAEVHALGETAQRAEIDPSEGLKRLHEILRKGARFGPVGTLLGHAILTVGLAMVLRPALTRLALAALLGAIVGALKLVERERSVLFVPLPVAAAALVSSLVFLAVKQGLSVEPLPLLVPPLVTFLPGAMLTLGMVELAYGDMVSGASRLMTGFVQLVLLAFGLAAGAALVGFSPDKLVAARAPLAEVAWVPWVGVAVFGIGMYLHLSAPRRSFPWILAVLLLAFAAQQLAAAPFGNEISGFFGTLVATPLAYLIQLRFGGPPASVTFLPSFWLLVPGSLSLLSVTRMMSDRVAGVEGMVTAIFAIASIALGTLVGASLYRWITEKLGRLGIA
jgi:uncharacterized membrane protein YjjP (DUF1212 family)/uncharacterized membrane protein YjjB (DUF3815 family)